MNFNGSWGYIVLILGLDGGDRECLKLVQIILFGALQYSAIGVQWGCYGACFFKNHDDPLICFVFMQCYKVILSQAWVTFVDAWRAKSVPPNKSGLQF